MWQVKCVEMGGSLLAHAMLVAARSPARLSLTLRISDYAAAISMASPSRAVTTAATCNDAAQQQLSNLAAEISRSIIQPLRTDVTTQLLDPTGGGAPADLNVLCMEIVAHVMSHLDAVALCRVRGASLAPARAAARTSTCHPLTHVSTCHSHTFPRVTDVRHVHGLPRPRLRRCILATALRVTLPVRLRSYQQRSIMEDCVRECGVGGGEGGRREGEA